MAAGCSAGILLDERSRILGMEYARKKPQSLGGHRGKQQGKFFVITDNKGDESRCIFILEGPQAGGWRRMIVALVEIVGRKFDVPGKLKVLKLSTRRSFAQRWSTTPLSILQCPSCKVELI